MKIGRLQVYSVGYTFQSFPIQLVNEGCLENVLSYEFIFAIGEWSASLYMSPCYLEQQPSPSPKRMPKDWLFVVPEQFHHKLSDRGLRLGIIWLLEMTTTFTHSVLFRLVSGS